VKSFGEGLLLSPHGIHVDKDGNVWVTDCACTQGRNAPRDSTKGHQVYKFSPDGRLLLTLGKAGGAREPSFFWQPNDVVTDKSGNIYVAEGHSDSSAADPTPVARILVFDKKGNFKRAWGTYGAGVGQMKQPHALAFDSRGRLFVGDRSNNRILILDDKFNILDTWYQFSRPSGIYIDAYDQIYVADSESGSVNPAHASWKRGIRVGSARTGQMVAFIPDPAPDSTRGTSAAEGVAADKNGNIYGAEVGPRALKRYVRQP
jgi:sugar lactone lactonase YvrE